MNGFKQRVAQRFRPRLVAWAQARHQRRALGIRRRARVLLAAVLVTAIPLSTWAFVSMSLASGTAQAEDATTTTTGATTTSEVVPTTYPPPPPAPADFPSQVDSLYGDINTVIQATGLPSQQASGQQLPTTSQFDQLVDQLTSDQLADLYAVTQSVSGWSGLPATYQQLATEVAGSSPPPTTTTTTAATTTTTSPPTTTTTSPPTTTTTKPPATTTTTSTHGHIEEANVSGSGSFPPAPPSGSFPPAPQPFAPSSPPSPNQSLNCPATAPGALYGEAGIYAATVAAEVLDYVESLLPDQIEVPLDEFPISIDIVLPDPVRVVAAVAAGAAHVTADSLQYIQNYWGNCLQNDWGNYLSNIDNTTIETYQLLIEMDQTLQNVQGSVDSVETDVQTIQETLQDQLTLEIEQALSTPGAAPEAAYEIPSSDGGDLDSSPVGVEEIVETLLQEAAEAGVPVNQTATRDLSLATQDLGAGSYKAAYAQFQAAYVEVAG